MSRSSRPASSGAAAGSSCTQPGDFEADYANAFNNFDADVANNSIGTNTATNGFPCSITGDYGLMASLIDGAVRGSLTDGRPIRIVWANGNEPEQQLRQHLQHDRTARRRRTTSPSARSTPTTTA